MKKIIIDGNEFLTVEDAAQYICDNLSEEQYDQWLDDCYDKVEIRCIIFYASDIMKNCDPIAYRCGFSDFQSFEYEYIEQSLNDEDLRIYGFDIEYIEEEEDE